MRVLMLMAVLVTVALSGCSSDTGLNSYLMRPSEAPAECRLTDLSDGEGEDIARFTGLKSNPGRINGSLWSANDIEPIDNRVALYACGDDEFNMSFISVVQRFANADDATAWLDAATYCDESPLFQHGAVVGSIEPDGNWQSDWLEHAEQVERRIHAKAGVVDVCPET